ncbi:hypothetical protein [Roseibium sp.]|uniref:hypothetical protein n=1 Tax=Roseibium sp. TaxID=1936156 RepID=UPI003B5054C4
MKTVFLSWQSDSRAACNRTLIEQALQRALSRVASHEEIEIDLGLDRDTEGVPGSPDIASSILEKISKAYVFVADITIVGQTQQYSDRMRDHCNPNVLIELGYAIRALDFSRIILVQNTFFGAQEKLPFDIRARRVVGYHSDPEADERATARRGLEEQLYRRLVEILTVDSDMTGSVEEEPITQFDLVGVKDRLRSLIENQPDDAAQQLNEIVELMDRSNVEDEVYSDLLNAVIMQLRRSNLVPKEQLVEICNKIVGRSNSPPAHFNIGFLSRYLGKPYDSIAGYMNAIEAGDPNPSLCFLNAGNRFRELNDERIAIAFFEKSVELNDKQANAWIGAAQLYSQLGEVEDAKRNYRGYLEWFDNLPESHKERHERMASVARDYLQS